jgi:hypothetical protein
MIPRSDNITLRFIVTDRHKMHPNIAALFTNISAIGIIFRIKSMYAIIN